MVLNHINLTVTDVQAAKNFLAKYFELQPYTGPDERKNFAFLFDSNGMVITLMKGKTADYPPNFHIGFSQPSEEKVDELNARLKADGFAVDPPERWHAYTFYVQAPGGFTVEVMS